MTLEVQQELLEIIKEVFPGLEFTLVLDTEWSSLKPESRIQIREAILAHAKKVGFLFDETEEQLVLDLSSPPHPKNFAVSISHSPVAGGFAFIGMQRDIGFDLEVSERIEEKTIARVSTEKELFAAPSPAHLWVAKEAAFKAFGSDKLKTMSQIETSNWIPLKNNFWAFKALCGADVYGSGVSGVIKQQHLSLFLVSR